MSETDLMLTGRMPLIIHACDDPDHPDPDSIEFNGYWYKKEPEYPPVVQYVHGELAEEAIKGFGNGARLAVKLETQNVDMLDALKTIVRCCIGNDPCSKLAIMRVAENAIARVEKQNG